jgi:hypothetical protein
MKKLNCITRYRSSGKGNHKYINGHGRRTPSLILLAALLTVACDDPTIGTNPSNPITAPVSQPSNTSSSNEPVEPAAEERPRTQAGSPEDPVRPGRRSIAQQKATSVEYQDHLAQRRAKLALYQPVLTRLAALRNAVTGDLEANIEQMITRLREYEAPPGVVDALRTYIDRMSTPGIDRETVIHQCEETLHEIEESFPGVRALLESGPPILPCVTSRKTLTLSRVQSAVRCYAYYEQDACLAGLSTQQNQWALALLNGEEVNHEAL